MLARSGPLGGWSARKGDCVENMDRPMQEGGTGRWSPITALRLLACLLLFLVPRPAFSQDVCKEAGLGFPLFNVCDAYCNAYECHGEGLGPSLQWLCDLIGDIWDAKAGGRTLPCLDLDDTAGYRRIHIVGETTVNGVYDPAIAYDDAGEGWMVYTAVVFGSYHYTNLAKTSDSGHTWQFVSTINESRNGMVMVEGRPVSGVWRNEVPTLIHDPTDPNPHRRWKLFWHKYFARDPGTSADDRLFDYGWIAYKYADAPNNLAQGEEIRLFGADPYPRDPATGRTEYPVVHLLNQLDPALNDCVLFSEPGALVQNGVIYLSLDAGTTISGMGDWNNYRTVLFSSFDHGESWAYAGVLTDSADAMHLNAVVLTATALVNTNGSAYLLATPSGSAGAAGVYLFEFRDLGGAWLLRDGQGRLVLKDSLKPMERAASGGQGTYDPNGGVVMGNIVTGDGVDVFQIYSTGRAIGQASGGSL